MKNFLFVLIACLLVGLGQASASVPGDIDIGYEVTVDVSQDYTVNSFDAIQVATSTEVGSIESNGFTSDYTITPSPFETPISVQEDAAVPWHNYLAKDLNGKRYRQVNSKSKPINVANWSWCRLVQLE